MAENVMTRNFKMSDGAAVQEADRVEDLALRDAAELAPYGIDAARVADLLAKRNAFNSFPKDVQMLGLQQLATSTRNTARAALEGAMRGIKVRATTKYGSDNHPMVSSFGIGSISQLEDGKLFDTAQGVLNELTAQQVALGTEGVNAAFIANYTTQMATFDVATDAQANAIQNRDTATRDRIILGNALWKAVTDICRAGQDAFINTNEAKYNDYVLSESDGLPTRTGTIVGGTTVKVEFEDILGEESFKLQNTSAVGADGIVFYCAAAAGDPLTTSPPTVAPGESLTITASELGWAADKPYLWAQQGNTGNPDVTFKVTRMG